jgi:integrase
MATKITKATLPRLTCPSGKAEVFHWDSDLTGFGLRASAGGKRTWVAQYRAAGRTRRLTLGDVSVVAVEKARDAARVALAGAALGHDPAHEKQQARRAVRVADLVAAYIDHQTTRLKPRSLAEVARHLNKHLAPLHHDSAASVTRGQVVGLLGRIAKDSGPVAANRVRASLGGMWTWAMRSGRVDGDNPVARTPKAGNEAPRDRVLTDAELAGVWHATESGSDHDRIVRLLLLTGARREEAAGMAWGEIAGGVWTLPANRSKNNRAHEVPLGPLALAQLPSAREGRALIFGKGAGGFAGWSRCKERLDRRVGLAPWTLHDLRRTVATRLADLGVHPHIIEAVLNHASGHKAGVAGIYNRSAYTNEKRAALLTWESHVRALIGMDTEAANVVRLRA